MELTNLIHELSRPAAYPHAVATVEVRQTHISAVFLAGPFAYKIKKPVDMGFLDFRTLDKRRHFCEEEVRLNRRLAPDVYRGVVPVTQSGTRIMVEGTAPPIEWAVKMERLPDDATLLERLKRGELGVPLVEALAKKIARFHADAEAGAHVAAFGRFDIVAQNARENFDQSLPQIGTTISRQVFDRLKSLTEESLGRLHPLIEDRARRHVPRDTHGDLHLDHVYLFPDRPPPADLVAIDCIEFNERFRFADPVADMAFLVMDLTFHERRDLARSFTEAYFRFSNDPDGRALLPLYVAYRAAVRAKVEGFELAEKEIPEEERCAALARARAHWLLALSELETPGQKPCLILVGGLPGSGKSTLARGLADLAGFHLIRSDVVRKQLAGISTTSPLRSGFQQGIYTPAWTEKTYAECLRQAEQSLFDGMRVIVDATFGAEVHRQAFLDLARRFCVPALFLLCRADDKTARDRLQQRHSDASDADWSVYLEKTRRWEEISPGTRPVLRELATTGPPEKSLAAALTLLREAGLGS
jgi:aminoglycoside phosphotransferase family enzyme/predicted kinase